MRIARMIGCLGLLVFGSAALTWGQTPKNGEAPAAVPATFRSYIVFDTRFAKDDARNRQDKMHCLICENGLAPVVAVLAKSVPTSADAPLTKLLKALQPLTQKYRGDRFGAYAIFLRTSSSPDPGTKQVVFTKEVTVKQPDGTETKVTVDKEYPDDDRTILTPDGGIAFARETERDAVKKYADETATPQIPFGLAPTKSKASDTFGVGEEPDTITVVVYNRLAVAYSKTFKPDQLTDEKIKEIVAEAEKMIKGK